VNIVADYSFDPLKPFGPRGWILALEMAPRSHLHVPGSLKESSIKKLAVPIAECRLHPPTPIGYGEAGISECGI
jgi:hypothetical protein